MQQTCQTQIRPKRGRTWMSDVRVIAIRTGINGIKNADRNPISRAVVPNSVAEIPFHIFDGKCSKPLESRRFLFI